MEKELDTRTITTNSGNNIDANTINSGNSVAYNNGAIKNNTVNDSTPCTTGSGKHGEGTDLFSCEVEEIYDLFLNFKTTEHANSYRYFQSRLRTSLTSISVMLALTTVGQAIMAYLTTLHANVPYVFKPMALFAFAVMLLGLVIYGVKLTDHYNNYKSTFFTPDTAKNMENMFIIGLSVYSNIRLVLRTQQGECIGANFIDQLICNPLHSMNLLPPDTFVGLSILPMMFASVFRTADWNVILFSWILTIATMLLCTYLFHESKLVVLILQVYFPCSLIVLFESRRQSLAIFLMNQKLQFLLSENSRIAKQHATELKHLIGNVAHDLKTVKATNFYYLFCIIVLVLFL